MSMRELLLLWARLAPEECDHVGNVGSFFNLTVLARGEMDDEPHEWTFGVFAFEDGFTTTDDEDTIASAVIRNARGRGFEMAIRSMFDGYSAAFRTTPDTWYTGHDERLAMALLIAYTKILQA